ncbi:MAG: site-2 protease family protein [bacterium]|nr:site-2 protease family protein [bacterium]
MDLTTGIFVIIIIVFSAIIHEVMHGVAADYLGDKTARYAGRLTLNPIPHIDPFGSIFLPLILTLTHSPIFFGWAKPVPYNPYNLRPGRFSEAIVAGAGPASNAAIAILFGIIIRLHLFDPPINAVFFLIVLINVMLAIFNMIPIPPLDGSKIASAILPRALSRGYDNFRSRLEHQPFLGFGIVILFILFFGSTFSSVIYLVANLIAGQSVGGM